MQEYWDMISGAHHQRLISLAEKSGEDPHIALRNIINCLQGGNDAGCCLDYFRDSVTARQIEEMIDTLNV